MIAHLRRTRISPKKANLVAGLIRRKNAVEAVNILKFTPKKGAKTLLKVVESAISNATNNFKQDKSSLVIKEIIVTQGPTYKRFQPISRGRAHPILKRTSHITVKVESDPTLTKAAEPKKKAESKKAEPKKAESPKTEAPKAEKAAPKTKKKAAPKAKTTSKKAS